MELIGESLSNNLSNLSSYEVYFKEGDTGELRVYLERSLYQDEMDCIQTEILSQGVILIAPVTQDARILVIKFRKTIAPLLIIGGAIAAIVIGTIGWQLLRTETAGIPLWTWITGVGFILYTVSRRKKWRGKR